MSRVRTIVLPLAVVLFGVAAAVVIIRAKPEVERQATRTPDPVVRVVEAHPGSLLLTVPSQGTVEPRVESTLVAQVAGEIAHVTPAFATGAFFERGELLLEIDRRDYELALDRAEAELARARLRLEQEEAQAVVAREEWEELGEGAPSALTLRQPQLAEARAALRAAEAAQERAELDLDRTRVRAPFAGRVRAKRADLGQFVAPGTPLADLFSIDTAEVVLPIPQDQIAFLDLSLGAQEGGGARVVLRADLGGRRGEWEGRVVRTGGEIDPRSRMLHLIAEVDDPYGRRGGEREVLPMGLFVDAVIVGRRVEGIYELPRTALRDHRRLLVLENGDRLRYRSIELLRVERDTILVSDGLAPGDKVCVSTLEAVVDGMRVQAQPAAEPPAVGGA
ncbi:MAG: efflux RND transporter periplasmic adaptor subunit [Thermoanaerobaculia bacterium]|nr:efflux RND transporter periplasmic adaptor subunit [Thermoanaerobaculia bacterium]